MKKASDTPSAQNYVEPLQRAVAICGGQKPLGIKVGKSQAQVSLWLNRDKKAPANMVLKIEAATGVPRHELRPDIYPPDEYKAVAQILQQKKAA
ncbi:hypothetical protein GCM10011369_23260 [Neiella marina]|uniref:Helix-turn-helix domain-containing protein n=1 Tax=Neiella marina TaxID=508461 RepID=A0A8J2XPJ8_9GAMM|nr:YdaS family helix-turn-helix protein [Neiella marina]GGA80662.1 hypothetical protein GCM10011369_23260 [Neiella marina]